MKYRLGIDLGGTSAKIALVTDRRKIIREGSVRTAHNPNAQILVKQLVKVSSQLIQGKPVSHVGVGVAGDIDFQRGIVRVSPNLGWKNVPLKRLLNKAFKKSVKVDNDANVAAWGIYKTQAPSNIKHVIVVTLGTGVGGGIVLNGQLHRGATGSAGEIGHIIMDEKGPRCNCGNVGCLETYVGGFHLTRAVRRSLRSGKKSKLLKIFKENPKQITPLTLAKAAKQGDAYAQSVWNGVGHSLGVALGNLIYVVNPQMIFLSGGVAQAGSLILKPLWRVLKTRAFHVPTRTVKIQIAKDAAHVGVLGASLL